MKYFITINAIIILMFFAFSTASYASETTPDEEILMLRQRIAELENKVKEMEATLAEYIKQDKALEESGYGWQNIKNWRKLKTGMCHEEVLELLGEPIKTIDGVKTLWYYPDIYRGYVSFDNDGHLTGWHEP
ncbi:MAG: hypothetical protein JW944_14090 [Deltaproteobacteria bacterium]|nr:hypothetical protein [Deltaproteobacteria bacterium]